jgi:pimeloyl-ACP methyl ester carboxylesterase
MHIADGDLHLVSAARAGGRPASFWRFGAAEPADAARRAVPVLALPGLGLDGRIFGAATALGRDRDGVLWNPPNEQAYRPTMDDFAADALGALDAAGHAGRPAVLVGSSFGGMVALAAALSRPERVAALVLVGTSAGWPEVPGRLRALSRLLPWIPRRAFPAIFARLMAPSNRYADRALLESIRTQMLHRTRAFVEAAVDAMREFDARPRLAAVRCPVLVVHGEYDRVFRLASGNALAAGLPRARLVVVPACGHLPHATHPDVFSDAVRAFLRDAAP